MSEAKILSTRTAYKGGHIQVREDRVIEPAGHDVRGDRCPSRSSLYRCPSHSRRRHSYLAVSARDGA